jgi:multidrug efflux pump subunit AcrA (membrane-fusion protein)
MSATHAQQDLADRQPKKAGGARQGAASRLKRAISARRIIALLLLTIGVAAAVAGIRLMRRVQAAEKLATAPARGGEFLVVVRCRGELRSRRSIQISAPVNVPELRIVWLASSGGVVKQNDPVIRFDPSSARQQLTEKQATLQQAEATLEQAIAQARIQSEQDRRDFAAARYQVERAKLEASKLEIVSALQGEESRIDLALSEQKLRVQEAAVKLHEASDRARIASLTRQRDKAKAEIELQQERLGQMEIKAPLTGVIVYLPNYTQGWMNAKPFSVGDQAWPGAALAEIPDLAMLEIEGKIEEIDRGRVAAGQDVRVRIDSIPELSLAAKLEAISPLTEQGWEFPPTRSFRGYARLHKPDPRLRPGMNGSMDIVVNRIADAISIPSKAVFTRDGKPVVYVPANTGYRPVEVEVIARNPDEVAVRGISEGVTVTLTEPELKEKAR